MTISVIVMSRQFYPHFFSNRFFDDFRDRNFERHFTRPYWTDYTLKESNKFGDGVGNVKIFILNGLD